MRCPLLTVLEASLMCVMFTAQTMYTVTNPAFACIHSRRVHRGLTSYDIICNLCSPFDVCELQPTPTVRGRCDRESRTRMLPILRW